MQNPSPTPPAPGARRTITAGTLDDATRREIADCHRQAAAHYRAAALERPERAAKLQALADENAAAADLYDEHLPATPAPAVTT